MTREHLDPRLLELVTPLAELSPPAVILDKKLYSAFAGTRLREGLARRGVTTLIVTGGETECVRAGDCDGRGRPRVACRAADGRIM